MTAFLAITRVTIRQTLRPRRAIGLGLLSASAAFTYLLTVVGSSAARGSEQFAKDQAFDIFVGVTIGTFMNIIIPVVTLIIATSVLGDERRDGTMSFLVLRPISRFTISVSKVVAAFVESFALTGLGAVALGIIAAIRMESFDYFFPLVVGTAVATAAYSAVFVPLGYLLKRATLIGLTYVFVWENGIAGAVPAVAGISPWRIGMSAMAGLAPDRFLEELPSFAIGSITPGAGGALTKAIVLIALSAAAVASILQRRDLAG
ncbi:MAG: ABC transporter permease [Actinomycetota bacterium]|nr:ABC transporter permease [Actinomycetota bacterium]